jgi:hypothetical protein
VLVLANLADSAQQVPAEVFAALSGSAVDLLTEVEVPLWADLDLAPLQFVWLQV